MWLLATVQIVIAAAAVVRVLGGDWARLGKVSRVAPWVQVGLQMLLQVRLATLLSIRVLVKPILVLRHLVLVLPVSGVKRRWN